MSAALALAQSPVAAWRAGVKSLPVNRIPAPGPLLREVGRDGRADNWARVRLAMLRFLDAWGDPAAVVGWRDIDLFGVHRTAGALRADATGALVTNWPYRVIAVDRNTIVRARAATRLVFRGLTSPGESVPIWAFGDPARIAMWNSPDNSTKSRENRGISHV